MTTNKKLPDELWHDGDDAKNNDGSRTVTELVQQLSKTDAQYANDNTPDLALLRGKIRLSLAQKSRYKGEQVHFLTEGASILEQALFSFDEMPITLYLELSHTLANIYFALFIRTHQAHFATVAAQILTPLLHHNAPIVGAMMALLAQIYSAQNKLALAKHWRRKAQTFAKSAANDPVNTLIN